MYYISMCVYDKKFNFYIFIIKIVIRSYGGPLYSYITVYFLTASAVKLIHYREIIIKFNLQNIKNILNITLFNHAQANCTICKIVNTNYLKMY